MDDLVARDHGRHSFSNMPFKYNDLA